MQDKLENNYSVYQHVTPDKMYYFGQTQNVERRWRNNGAEYKGTSLYPYIEKFGWDNIKHIILFENQSKEDALKIEDSLIISGWEKGNCINKIRSGNISKDDVYIREYQREYQREYREKNREKYNEYHREYQREYQRQRYQRKKEEKQFKELGYIPLF